MFLCGTGAVGLVLFEIVRDCQCMFLRGTGAVGLVLFEIVRDCVSVCFYVDIMCVNGLS